MFRIGDFSKLSRISIRMLRHYNDLGLLVPEYVDEMTGYRYYKPGQLSLANRINSLKDMGFSLTLIGQILKEYGDEESLRKHLMIQHAQMKEQEQLLQNKLSLLQTTIQQLGKDCLPMKYNVTLKEISSRYVASLRQIIPSYNQEGLLWNQLMEETAAQKLQFAEPCMSLAVFHDEGYKEADVDVEIQISVTGKYQDTEHVRFKHVPQLLVTSTIIEGNYDQLGAANEVIAAWISGNQYEMNGPMSTIYHVGPGTEANPDLWVTEICYPVRKQ
ncbi:MAG: MerR family transcriptional regulator [Bacillota bacterium]